MRGLGCATLRSSALAGGGCLETLQRAREDIGLGYWFYDL
jgi:hypothetical protein